MCNADEISFGVMAMVGSNQDRNWVKPELVRIGKIGDIAANTTSGSSQCANGSPTCPTINKS